MCLYEAESGDKDMSEVMSFISDGYKQHYDIREDGVNYYAYQECGTRKESSITAEVATQVGQQLLVSETMSMDTIEGMQEELKRTTVDLNGKGRVHCSISIASESMRVSSYLQSASDTRKYSACQIAITSDLLSVQRTYPLQSELQKVIKEFLLTWKTTLLGIERNIKRRYVDSKATVVFAGGSGGFFIHEVFGHLVEGDSVTRSKSLLRKNYDVGDAIGAKNLTVVDDPSFNKTSTFLNMIDDEGVEMNEICMIKNGKLAGYLCDSVSSQSIDNGEAFIGCARRQSYKHASMPRMRSTRVSPCNRGGDLEAYINVYKTIVIVDNAIAGRVNPNTGAFALQCSGRLVIDGEQEGTLPSMVITGNVFEALPDIVAIGSDLSSYQVFCGKRGQHVPVSIESPTMVIEPLTVGGDLYAYND